MMPAASMLSDYLTQAVLLHAKDIVAAVSPAISLASVLNRANRVGIASIVASPGKCRSLSGHHRYPSG